MPPHWGMAGLDLRAGKCPGGCDDVPTLPASTVPLCQCPLTLCSRHSVFSLRLGNQPWFCLGARLGSWLLCAQPSPRSSPHLLFSHLSLRVFPAQAGWNLHPIGSYSITASPGCTLIFIYNCLSHAVLSTRVANFQEGARVVIVHVFFLACVCVFLTLISIMLSIELAHSKHLRSLQ